MKGINQLVALFNDMGKEARLRAGIFIAGVLALIIILSGINDRIARLNKKRIAREGEVAEMLLLKQRYREASASAQQISNRLAATRPDDSPAKVIEETGIKGTGSQYKPVKGEERGGYVEDAVEARIEGLTGNQMVNLLYRLEKGSKPVIIKKATIKTRFDDPTRLDLVMTVALLKAAPSGGK